MCVCVLHIINRPGLNHAQKYTYILTRLPIRKRSKEHLISGVNSHIINKLMHKIQPVVAR